MKKLTKTTVYVPVSDFHKSERAICTIGIPDLYGDKVIEQQAFVFNEEQLNELLSSVIKETLKVAAENAELDYWQGSCVLCGSNAVDEQSILNQFDNVFNKVKV